MAQSPIMANIVSPFFFSGLHFRKGRVELAINILLEKAKVN